MENNGWNKIIQHDCLQPFPLDDSCIDVVITSPPYWGLRDYGIDGQIGLESHPSEYIDHLVQVASEVRRVLKKSGSFYLNLGDTYFGSVTGQKPEHKGKMTEGQFLSAVGANETRNTCKSDNSWLQPKQLMLIPMRVAIALQDDGWILRNDIIWHKPNPMPSSVKDRLNNTFEHVFHFVKSRKYHYNLDSIREPHKEATFKRNEYSHADRTGKCLALLKEDRSKRKIVDTNPLGKNPGDVIKERGLKSGNPNVGQQQYHSNNIEYHPDGKNPGDIIEGGAILGESGAIKVPGGKGWTKKIPGGGARCAKDPRWCPPEGKNPGDFWDITTQPFTSYSSDLEHFAVFPEGLIMKPLKASCPKDGVVLDPFCGRGTVGKVAKDLGLNYVLFDIKPEYCELARLYVNGQKRKLIEYQQKLNYMDT